MVVDQDGAGAGGSGGQDGGRRTSSIQSRLLSCPNFGYLAKTAEKFT